MASLRRVPAFALFVSGVVGCASTYPTRDLPPPPDFSATAPPDMAGGTGGDGAGDLAVPGDLAAADLAGSGAADLASPPDLARCLLDDADGGVGDALYVVAPMSGGGLFAARRAGGAWTALPSAKGDVAEVALAAVNGRVLVAARLQDDALAGAWLDGCSGRFGALTAVAAGASTAARPALVGGSAGDLVFRGAVNGDQRYYWTHLGGAGWGAIATQGSFLSTQPPAALRLDGAVHAFFAGTDGNLWDGTVQASGGGTATQLRGNTSALAPAVAAAPDGRVHVVYTGTNHHLYWFVAAQPTQVHDLCDGQPAGCFIVSEQAPALAVAGDGAPLAVYRGTDGKLYASRLSGTQWSAAAPVSGSDTAGAGPAVIGGGDGGLAHVAWVRDGDQVARVATLEPGGWQAPVTVGAVALSGAPALAVAP